MAQTLAAVGITCDLLVKGSRGLKRSGPKTAVVLTNTHYDSAAKFVSSAPTLIAEHWTALPTALMHWAYRPSASCN